MGCFTFGDLVCEARRQLGITQEELAFGICSPGTISKIENGCAVPKRRNYEALMQRLGKAPSICQIHTTHGDMESYHSMREITRKLANDEVEEGCRLLQSYGQSETKDLLSRQFFHYMCAIADGKRGKKPEAVLAELEYALSLTVADTENYLHQKRLFTFDEMMIINNIAIQYQQSGRYKQAVRIWSHMKEYLEVRQMDEAEKEKVYPMILFNFANLLYEMQIYHEATELCTLGITYCTQCGMYTLLPCLLSCKSDNLRRTGDEAGAGECIRQAENMFEVFGEHHTRIRQPISLTV